MIALYMFIWICVGLWWSCKSPTYKGFVDRSVVISIIGVILCWLLLGVL